MAPIRLLPAAGRHQPTVRSNPGVNVGKYDSQIGL